MAKNIKEIGKELMGKSLNSFHRKTGLTQLEENNKMQDGILNGILSQVDDAYIEKTEQSNVLHLDGSGDGVVVLDGIEGNTMVNCSLDFNEYTMYANPNNPNAHLRVSINKNKFLYKPNTVYTIFIDVVKNTIQGYSHICPIDSYNCVYTQYLRIQQGQTGKFKLKIQTRTQEEMDMYSQGFNTLIYTPNGEEISGELVVKNIFILEGDWTNRELPSYFEGLQSSFEDKVNDEGKYEIEILSNNKNLLKIKNDSNYEYCEKQSDGSIISNFDADRAYAWLRFKFDKQKLPKGEYYITFKLKSLNGVYSSINGARINNNTTVVNDSYVNIATPITTNDYQNYCTKIVLNSDKEFNQIFIQMAGVTNTKVQIKDIMITKELDYNYIPQISNKIKLLINEPLRSVNNNYKDRLCIKDGRLVIERKCGIDKNLHLRKWYMYTLKDEYPDVAGFYTEVGDMKIHNGALVCDKFKCMERDLHPGNVTSNEEFLGGTGGATPYFKFNIKRSKLNTLNPTGFKTYLQQNPVTVVYPLKEPFYEEVLNEYGEPIILEGYENGTIYIDSTIVPTTTVRYTPKMESFKTLKEVNNNNIMLTNDVNDNIIPYMMDVDLMIMEKEMALMSHTYKLRRIGESDMTSMQKRTQDMLTRLIKGKTLTEQECKTRVVTYLDAGKITDAQADELMLLISEVYA